MRAESKRLGRAADAWQSAFCSDAFLAALYPKLPVSTKDERALVSDARRLSDTSAQAVDAFAEPLQALAAFREKPDNWDLLITDRAMPRLPGEMLAREI